MSYAIFVLFVAIESAYVALQKRRVGKGFCRRSFEQEECPMSMVSIAIAVFHRFMEARQRSAEIELARHGLRLPRELEDAGLKISERNEDALPFVR